MNTPAWLKDAVFYQIYPQTFYDTNGDGIGDIEGIIQKLDYLTYMGYNAVWLNPCYLSPFQDAGYDVTDFYTVADRYGTNADLARLFKEANARGIHICIDLVAGHTSNQHRWFQASAKPTKNEYTNRYIWTDWVWHGSGMQEVIAYSDRDGRYVANFFYFQAALNYGFEEPDPEKPWQLPTDHPDVRALVEEMKRVMRFWLDMGASGFRVDMADSLVRNDPEGVGIRRLWREFRTMFDEDYPNAALISEWGNCEKAIHAGFHVDFLLSHVKPLRDVTRARDFSKAHRMDYTKAFFHKKGEGDIKEFIDNYTRVLQSIEML